MSEIKSKFNFFDQTGVILVIAVCVLAASLRAAVGFVQYDDQRQYYFLFGALFGICLLAYLWQVILKEINHITVTDSEITLTNLLTRRVTTLRKIDLKGFQDTYKNGRRILLINKSDQVVTRVYEKYYVNFKYIIESLDLKYLGEK